MKLIEKIFLTAFMVLSILLTVSGFIWEGWTVFLGLTFIASTAIAMLGAWSSPHKKLAPKQVSKLISRPSLIYTAEAS
jgi:hypothetical protein